MSLYEIDRILDEKMGPSQEDSEEVEEDMLKRTILKEYHDLIRVFSKKELDKLPSH